MAGYQVRRAGGALRLRDVLDFAGFPPGAWSREPGACKFCPEHPARSYMAAVQPETKIAVGSLLVGKYKVTRELGRG